MAGNCLILSSVLSTTVPLFVERTGADSAFGAEKNCSGKRIQDRIYPPYNKTEINILLWEVYLSFLLGILLWLCNRKGKLMVAS